MEGTTSLSHIPSMTLLDFGMCNRKEIDASMRLPGHICRHYTRTVTRRRKSFLAPLPNIFFRLCSELFPPPRSRSHFRQRCTASHHGKEGGLYKRGQALFFLLSLEGKLLQLTKGKEKDTNPRKGPSSQKLVKDVFYILRCRC